MNDIELDTPNNRKVLDIYLQNPARSFSYLKLRPMLGTLSETSIRDALRALESSKILEVSHAVGRPKKREEKTKIYSISDKPNVFKKLSEMYLKAGIDEFVKSEYIKSARKRFTPGLLERASSFGFKSVRDFVELDIQLSPITSMRTDFSPKLLLYHPFVRIFSDVYLLSEEDIEKFTMRAYILYSNFPEMFSSAIKYIILERNDHRDFMRDIESLVKQAIFYWNISSHNFDIVYSCLEDAINEKDKIEFYIEFIDGAINIKKLNESLDWAYLSTNALIGNYFVSEPVQLEYLRPCHCFTKRGYANDPIRHERIASEVKAHFDVG